ncbi:MAG: hypothetical protein EPO61_09850 [Nitrospirae bacterium]|nr:MAG: hypothetical protein EPO61_09850 [Nitrospirota bacterium]
MPQKSGESGYPWIVGLCVFMLATACLVPAVLAFDWVPSDEEIKKYRKSWNPMANGPILISGVDIQPKGQFLFQPFVFGQIGHEQFGNQFSSGSKDATTHLRAVAPTGIFAYGISNHVELNVAFSGIYWESNKATGSGSRTYDSESGLGDTTIYVKYRPIVQDPDGWRPSITIYNQIALPSSQWAGTRGIPGGFSPLGRIPATRFGALSFTEGAMFRKNLEPFRISGGVFYTYTNPGSTGGMNTYTGDIVNTRLVIEHILNDQQGFGYNLEFVTLHGVPYRLDGHAVNINPTSFSLVGVQPSLQYKFFQDEGGALVGAAGVLFTAAGQNNVNAFYPNISLYYYWGRGKVLMR